MPQNTARPSSTRRPLHCSHSTRMPAPPLTPSTLAHSVVCAAARCACRQARPSRIAHGSSQDALALAMFVACLPRLDALFCFASLVGGVWDCIHQASGRYQASLIGFVAWIRRSGEHRGWPRRMERQGFKGRRARAAGVSTAHCSLGRPAKEMPQNCVASSAVALKSPPRPHHRCRAVAWRPWRPHSLSSLSGLALATFADFIRRRRRCQI
mmetsp:Transcript_14616/g.42776  ORF Transcript_14616/g.42776 Transcript_14616/m.42776 type:complete len:211 (+) Transcript_14616:347-979(+)